MTGRMLRRPQGALGRVPRAWTGAGDEADASEPLEQMLGVPPCQEDPVHG